MKKAYIYIFIGLLFIIGFVFYLKSLENETITVKNETVFEVGLVYLLQHPAIDQGISGFKQRLNRIEKSNNVHFNVTYSNAFGEAKNINTILATFEQQKVDAIVALTTPCAQIAKKTVKDIPVIFVGISDPVSAGLVDNLENGKENITGTSSKDPNFETLELATRLFPDMKKVGIIYSSSEANSISILENIKQKIQSANLHVQIVQKSVTNTIEILPATKALLSDVDALFLINDNTIISSVELLIREANKANKPIFASDIESVKKGALFTYGLDYKDEGIAAANILSDILLKNKKPYQIPIFVNKSYYLYINNRLLDYKVDTGLIKGAEFVGE